jgi:hypothetical protein
VTVGATRAADWRAWHRRMVIDDDPSAERDGALVFLSPDMASELSRIELPNVSIATTRGLRERFPYRRNAILRTDAVEDPCRTVAYHSHSDRASDPEGVDGCGRSAPAPGSGRGGDESEDALLDLACGGRMTTFSSSPTMRCWPAPRGAPEPSTWVHWYRVSGEAAEHEGLPRESA